MAQEESIWERLKKLLSKARHRILDIFRGKQNFYGKIEDELDNIGLQLEVLENLEKEGIVSKELLEKRLGGVEEALEYMTNVNFDENNLEEFEARMQKVENSLNNIRLESESNTGSGFSEVADKFFDSLSEEEIMNADYFVNKTGLYVKTDKGCKHFYFADSSHSIFLYDTANIKIDAKFEKIEELGKPLSLYAQLPDVDARAAALKQLCLTQMSRYMSGKIEKDKKYIELVNRIIGNGEKTGLAKTKYGEVEVNKDVVRLKTEKGLSTLRYDKEQNCITLYHNDEVIAEWNQRDGRLKETVFVKQDRLNLTKELDNPYVYAMFEAHHLKRKDMEPQIKRLGEITDAKIFPYVDISKAGKVTSAIEELAYAHRIESKPKYVNGKAEGISRIEFMADEKTYAISLKPSGDINNVFVYDKKKGWDVAKNDRAVKELYTAINSEKLNKNNKTPQKETRG